MTNFQVYRKTISYSALGFLVDLFAMALLGGLTAGGFLIFNQQTDKALIGMAVGFAIGVVLAILISVFISNRIKAAQIAMMVKGVTEGNLPEHTFSEGFKEIRGRFGKITAFYFITSAIKGVFRQLGRAINRLGTALGGDVGNSITSVINSAVETIIAYLCDCCLGWILYRKDENAFKAGCEGAVIFFKHGKTFARNAGRIFGMGLLSLILVGGGVFGLSYIIYAQFPSMFEVLRVEIAEAFNRGGEVMPEALNSVRNLELIFAGATSLILWSTIHSVLFRPFILVGVLRNYMEAGLKDVPTEADFAELDKKSPRFARLHSKVE